MSRILRCYELKITRIDPTTSHLSSPFHVGSLEKMLSKLAAVKDLDLMNNRIGSRSAAREIRREAEWKIESFEA